MRKNPAENAKACSLIWVSEGWSWAETGNKEQADDCMPGTAVQREIARLVRNRDNRLETRVAFHYLR